MVYRHFLKIAFHVLCRNTKLSRGKKSKAVKHLASLSASGCFPIMWILNVLVCIISLLFLLFLCDHILIITYIPASPISSKNEVTFLLTFKINFDPVVHPSTLTVIKCLFLLQLHSLKVIPKSPQCLIYELIVAEYKLSQI